MSDERIERSLDDIMRDSLLWAQASEVLQDATVLAERLPISESDFSYLAVKGGIHTIYEEIREELARLLREGRDSQEDISRKLYDTAKQYEETEQDAEDRAERIATEMEQGS